MPLHPTESRALGAYRERFGGEPEVLASAPGRVNLIGEHTDYGGGFVLPCAVGRRVAVAAGRGLPDEPGVLFSSDFGEARPLQSEPGADGGSSWADYPRGVVWALGEAGYEAGGFRAAFAGDVPLGAGLSSSAAVEAATVLALDRLFRLDLDRREAALLCRRAENGYVGVQSGILDQFASLMCREGEALFVDCRTLEARPVPLDLDRANLSLLVCDTNAPRVLAETGYNDRREVSERAAKTLGLAELRDASPGDLERLGGEELRRARHVVTENARVLRAVEALEGGDFREFGGLMYASHASMRDDYEISTPSHDAFVELAREAGALGARLTGGGFGGCAISLVPSENVDGLKQATFSRFAKLALPRPDFYTFLPAAGARVVPGQPSGQAEANGGAGR
ncbi:galactokinase [Rubrobacter radiotolerans]|nr:galactokinase [Rubrobacter radiotolerans]MDX5894506.1 galactokinase [Rubrobacter radiotolerans]SMC06147.1 galactokinase [Rubrobacter radiotolerans DSM 5868]